MMNVNETKIIIAVLMASTVLSGTIYSTETLSPDYRPSMVALSDRDNSRSDSRRERAIEQALVQTMSAESTWADYENLTELYLANGLMDPAKPLLEKMRKDSTDPAKWYYRSYWFERGYGDRAQGILYLKKAIELAPQAEAARWNLGNDYVESEAYGLAKAVFAEMVQVYPESAYGWLGLARVALSDEEGEAFEASLGKATALAPDLAEVRFLLAMASARGGSAHQTDQTDAVVDDSEQWVGPSNPWLDFLVNQSFDFDKLEMNARRSLAAGQEEAAERALLRAIEVGSEEGLTYQLLGGIYLRKNDEALAKKAFDRAMELAPKTQGLYPLLVEFATRYEASDWLLEHLLKGEAVLDQDAFIQHQLGLIYLKKHELEKAETAFQKAYSIDGTRYQALIDLCEVYRNLENRTGYVDTLNTLYLNHWEEEGVDVLLGNAWMLLGDWQHLYALRTSMDYKMKVTDEEQLLRRGLGFVQRNAFYEGLRALESVLYENPRNAVALYNLGNLLCRFRNFEEGIKTFQLLGEIAPNDPRPFTGIAKAALETKQYSLGLYAAEKADELIQKQPEFAFLKSNVEALLVQYWDLL